MTSIFAIDFTFEKNVHTKKSEKKLTHTYTHTHTRTHTHTHTHFNCNLFGPRVN